VAITLGVPRCVHLVPKADYDRVAELPHAVGVRLQVVVVGTVRYCLDRGISGSICTMRTAPWLRAHCANDATKGCAQLVKCPTFGYLPASLAKSAVGWYLCGARPSHIDPRYEAGSKAVMYVQPEGVQQVKKKKGERLPI